MAEENNKILRSQAVWQELWFYRKADTENLEHLENLE